jgi:hypothetical protein
MTSPIMRRRWWQFLSSRANWTLGDLFKFMQAEMPPKRKEGARAHSVGQRWLKARNAGRVCRRIAFRMAMLFDVANGLLHNLKSLTEHGFAHVKRGI